MGLMLAEPGFHTRCFVEWEEYPRSTLIAAQRAGYFASAPIWDDLTTFDARPFAGCIDTLLAGYPCQPFSHAGQRKGADDERHLWPDVARVARELGPSLEWLLLENVAGHLTLGLETVLRDLRDMDFTPAVGLFTAAETGAPHERERVFIVAHRQSIGAGEQNDEIGAFARGDAWRGIGRSSRGLHGELADTTGPRREPARARTSGEREGGRPLPRSGSGTMADTSSGRHGGSCQGEVEQPWRAETVRAGDDVGNAARFGRGEGWTEPVIRGGRDTPSGAGSTMADASGPERQGQQRRQHHQGGRQEPDGHPALSRGTGIFPPGPADTGRWGEALGMAPDLAPAVSFGDVKRFADHLAQMVARGELAEAEAQSRVRRMADGLALRSRALRLLGNGVHPLAAGHAWRTLSSAHGLRPLDLVAASAEDGAGTDGALVMADQWGGWAEAQEARSGWNSLDADYR